MNRVTKGIKHNILASINESSRLIAEVQTSDIKQKQQLYQIRRAVGEVRQILEDTTAQLGWILEEGNYSVENILSKEDESSVVVLTVPLSAVEEESLDYDTLQKALSQYSVRADLEKVIGFKLKQPSAKQDAIAILVITISLSPELLSLIGASDFRTRMNKIHDYIEEVLSDEFVA